MTDATYYAVTKEQIKAIVKRMGEACIVGENHAIAGTQAPGFSKGYEDPDLRAAYLIGLNRMKETAK